MTQQDIRTELERSAAAAARTTPGVAFLRPSLTGLLRTVAQRTEARPEGVRAVRNPADGIWSIELRLTVRRGYRALDVTRAVRLAVEEATRPVIEGRDGSGDGRLRATVIVTGVV
ncbi:Asp23/Gls24 family envelope stress response protein [Streptomyces sp. NPDC055749]